VVQGEAWNPRSLDAAALRRALSGYDIVVVHQALCPFGLFIAAHAKALRKRVYGLDHGGGEHPITRHTAEIGRVFDGFIAQSAFCANSFADLDAPTRVSLGPVDTDWYTPGADGERTTDVVLAVGRLLPHKGIDRIIAALPEGLKLRAIGSRYDDAYFEHLTTLSAGKNVEFVEGLSDEEVRDEYRRVGLVVHASTHMDYLGRHYPKPELLGLAPLEALACGARVLVSNAGALPELADVPGCDAFGSDEALSKLLLQYRDGLLPSPSAHEIAAATADAYGPAAFCRTVGEMMGL
jgi:glycosyltransferase involved in cell wall biosynthesis